ncbi:hypothetical protein JCM3765_000940 [Sporobolomyces pararoseus]
MHAKSYRAPSQGERIKEANDRYRLDTIKHEEKRLKETNRLLERQQQLSRRTALQVPSSSLGGRLPLPRSRSRSFNGFPSGSPYLAGDYLSPSIALGGGPSPRLGSYGHTMPGDRHLQQVELERRRLQEAELSNLRARREALEVEAERTRRRSSTIGRERHAQTQYLGSPKHFHSPVIGSPYLSRHSLHGHDYNHTLSVPQFQPDLPVGGLRRTRSFGSIPFGSSTPLHVNHYSHPSPLLQPLPQSPRVVSNYTPHNYPYEANSQFGGFERAGGAGIGTSEFVITDLDYDENGRQILSELGWVEGDSSRCPSLDEDELLSFAIQDLTTNARQRGANAVLAVETGEDAAGRGIVILRGQAVVLS